jgi:hypothetical protein
VPVQQPRGKVLRRTAAYNGPGSVHGRCAAHLTAAALTAAALVPPDAQFSKRWGLPPSPPTHQNNNINAHENTYIPASTRTPPP